MSSGHARLSPSNHRWPYCPGSVREEARYPDIAGESAIDGTGSHLLLELCMIHKVPASHYLGQLIGANHEDKPEGWIVKQDRVDRVQMCLDHIDNRVRELWEQYPGATVTVHTESRSDPGAIFGRDDWAGTADITIEVMLDGHLIHIEVIDYKDGRGWVNVKENTQLTSYLLGKSRKAIGSGPEFVRPLRPGKLRSVRASIVQPKTNPVVRHDDMTPQELIDRGDKLAAAAIATDDPNARLVAGPHCEWCKANKKRGGHCSKPVETSLEVIPMNELTTDGNAVTVFQQLMLDPSSMPSEQLSKILDGKEALVAAFERIETEIETRLNNGEPVPGYALKPGRSTRVWNGTEEEIVKMLKGRRLKKDEIMPPTLISPAQMEKLPQLTSEQKERIVREFVSVKAGKLKLTKVAHGQEKTAHDMFKDVVQSDNNVIQYPGSVFEESDKKTDEVSAPQF